MDDLKPEQKPEQKKRGPKPKVDQKTSERVDIGENVFLQLNESGAAVLISCKPSERAKAAQDAYAYLEGMAEAGEEVILKNGVCGSSVSFNDIETFPAKNRACGCGNKKHSIVRYKFI